MLGFKKKKDNLLIKPAKKKGCLDNFIVLVVFSFLFIILVVDSISKINFSDFKDFDLGENSPFIDFDVSSILTDPITDTDKSIFHTKLINAGYSDLSQNFNSENFENNTIPLTQTLEFTAKEYAVLINYILFEETQDSMKILQFNITKQDDNFKFDIVYTYNLRAIEGINTIFDLDLYSSQTLIVKPESDNTLSIISNESTHHSIKSEHQDELTSGEYDESVPELILVFFNGASESNVKKIHEYFLADSYTLDNNKIIITPKQETNQT